jgi:hypothetical protein
MLNATHKILQMSSDFGYRLKMPKALGTDKTAQNTPTPANPFMPRLDYILFFLEAGVVTRLGEPGW